MTLFRKASVFASSLLSIAAVSAPLSVASAESAWRVAQDTPVQVIPETGADEDLKEKKKPEQNNPPPPPAAKPEPQVQAPPIVPKIIAPVGQPPPNPPAQAADEPIEPAPRMAKPVEPAKPKPEIAPAQESVAPLQMPLKPIAQPPKPPVPDAPVIKPLANPAPIVPAPAKIADPIAPMPVEPMEKAITAPKNLAVDPVDAPAKRPDNRQETRPDTGSEPRAEKKDRDNDPRTGENDGRRNERGEGPDAAKTDAANTDAAKAVPQSGSGAAPPPTADQMPKPVATPTPAAAMPPAVVTPGVAGGANTVAPTTLQEIKKARVERVEAGGNRVFIQEPDKRVIIKENNTFTIQSDENERMKRVAPTANFEQMTGGGTKAVVERPGNVKIISETDTNGQLVRRYRRDSGGLETSIIDNRRRKKDRYGRDLAIGVGIGAGVVAGAVILNQLVNVPRPRVTIPRDKYIVRYEDASDEDVYEALSAPPVERVQRYYTLDQVRATQRLRDRMRRVDLDDVNFEFGSWDVDPAEYRKLERVARAMMRVIRRNPNEVFLIEGYTDAVGSEVDNLTLSDRRAEAVAQVLTEQFQVPFENLTTQGYGENYLKIRTLAPERINRRVAVRRITPLLARGGVEQQPPPGRYDDEPRRYNDEPRDDPRRYDDRDRYDGDRREPRRY